MTFDDFEAAITSHLEAWWTAAGQLPHRGGTIDPPAIAAENGPYNPGTEPYIDLDVLWSSREITGTPNARTYEARGILQVNLYVPSASGTALLARMADRVEQAWKSLQLGGLKVYSTMPPQTLPAPLTGFYGKHVDTSFLWISAEADEAVVMTDSVLYTQPGHGLVVTQVVTQVAGAWATAQANGTDPTDASELARGIVWKVPDTDHVRVVSESATIELPLGLVEGDEIWLSQAAPGQVVTTAPASGWVQKLGTVLPGGLLLWHREPWKYI